MQRKILEWQGIALLFIIIVLGAQFAWERFTKPEAGILASRVESGVLTELEQLVVSEQINKFSEFVNFENSTAAVKMINWLPGLHEVGKATVFFKWQARSLYGIKITDKSPLQWKRVTGQPGVIEISSPEISVLETKVGLGKDEFVAAKIAKSAFVSEEAKMLEYLPQIEARSDQEAAKTLNNEYLRANASRIIGHHVMSLINQGATNADKVHTANVIFRKS